MEQLLSSIERHTEVAFWLGVFILALVGGLVKLFSGKRHCNCCCDEEEDD